MSDKSKVHFPHLDGLRFICFISIFFFHSFATDYKYISTSKEYLFIKYGIFGNANLGVNFFFVLSGFLITGLLIQEKQHTGTINIKNFYIRRILRIWPLFYFCVLFGFVLFPFIKKMLGTEPHEVAHLWAYLFFVNNFDFINNFPDCSVLGILWSIAVEEQFYLLWPLAFLLTPEKKLKYTFFIIIILSFVFRVLFQKPGYLDYHTLAVISDMAVGGLAAYYCFKKTLLLSFFSSLSAWVIAFLYILVIFLYFFKQYIFVGPRLVPFERLVMSVLFVCVILEQNYSNKSLFKMGNNKLFSKLGKYTYGMYCLHMIGILIVATALRILKINTNIWQVILLEGGLSLLLTTGIAYISYNFYEKKFLAFKDKFN